MSVFLIKTLFKDILSLALYPFIRIKDALRNSTGVRVLVYHCIREAGPRQNLKDIYITEDLFEKQMNYLFKAKYNVLSLNELCDYMKGIIEIDSKKNICLTFDDGFGNDYTVLQKLGFKATIFAVYNFVEREAVCGLNNNVCSDKAFSWSQLRQLSNNGFCIGSHSLSHRNLGNLNIAGLKEEIVKSKEMFERKLSRPISFFAYPFGGAGSFNQTTRDIVKKAGFMAAFINLMGTNKRGDDLFTLKRVRISQDDRMWRFRLKLVGAYDWVDFIKRLFKC